MEKTNELNKFLSYIHMGTTIFRIYYEQAHRLKNEKLLNKIVEIEEIFKTHEESITNLIEEFGEKATDSLTMAGIMGVYKERMKILDDDFSICINAIKSTNMGYVSAIKFLYENRQLFEEIKIKITEVINDYENIIGMLKKYIFEEIVDKK